MITLGLDPGTSATGYGSVLFERGCLHLERCGVWRPPDRFSLAAKLNFLSDRLLVLLDELRPAAVSVETVFAAKSVSSAVKLSHARGVLLAAAAHFDIPVRLRAAAREEAHVGSDRREAAGARMVLTLLASSAPGRCTSAMHSPWRSSTFTVHFPGSRREYLPR